MLPWLPHYVTMVTTLCYHGNHTMLPWLPHYVTMVTPSTGRSHCKHKEQLAHFTNVSVTTLESETESEQSFASTICTQITGKAQIRSFPSLQTYFLENQ